MEKGRNFGVSLWDINILASVNWESEREREDLFIAFTLEWEIEEEGLDIAGGKLDVGGEGGGEDYSLYQWVFGGRKWGFFIFGYLKLDINASIYGQTKKRCGS